MSSEVLVIQTCPAGVSGAALFSEDTAADVVFCCYFRDEARRRLMLREMRTVAGGRPEAQDDRGAVTDQLGRTYSEQLEAGDHVSALLTAIRWRTLVQGREYHTYTLREGQEPYPWGLVVAFSAQDADELRANLRQAEYVIRSEREKVMDVFGWGIQR